MTNHDKPPNAATKTSDKIGAYLVSEHVLSIDTPRLVQHMEEIVRIIASEYEAVLTRLTDAGKEVISCWETGDLAAAVRELDDAIKEIEQ